MRKITEHTPGPWKVEPIESQRSLVYCRINGSQSLGFAGVYKLDDKECQNECLANANLIAAAPELLEALETAVSWYQEWLELGPDAGDLSLDTLRKAIAKAKGEQQ